MMSKKKATKKSVKKVPAKKAVKRTTKKADAPKLDVSKYLTSFDVSSVVAETEADKIWNEIKDRTIEMFALPGQVVANHCTPITVEPTKLYLTIRSTATLPSLETAVGPNYVVELADKFVIVRRAVSALLSPQKH